MKTLRELRAWSAANPNEYWVNFFSNGAKGPFVDGLPRPYEFLNSLLDIAYHPCQACDYKYAIDYEITDQGILFMYAYLQTEVDAKIKEYNAWMDANYDDTIPDYELHHRCMDAIGDVKEQWNCEVPLTRGFSDTPDRRDTEFSSLDIDIATRDAVEQHEGVQHIYPWQLRATMEASGIIKDLGLEEEEIEELINKFAI